MVGGLGIVASFRCFERLFVFLFLRGGERDGTFSDIGRVLFKEIDKEIESKSSVDEWC